MLLNLNISPETNFNCKDGSALLQSETPPSLIAQLKGQLCRGENKYRILCAAASLIQLRKLSYTGVKPQSFFYHKDARPLVKQISSKL
jgi:hypothetical protein